MGVPPDSQVEQGVAIGSTWPQLPRILHQQVDFSPVVFAASQLDEQEDEMQPGIQDHVKVLHVDLKKQLHIEPQRYAETTKYIVHIEYHSVLYAKL
jgi:hypothetical protein